MQLQYSLVLWCVLSVTAVAYDERFGPFEAGQLPKAFPLVECQAAESKPKTTIYTSPRSEKVRLQISVTGSDNYIATVIDADGKPLCAPTMVCESNAFGMANGCYTADLNHDGKPDFVACVYLGGCGLAVEYNAVAFVLSSGGGYNITTITTMGPTGNDFIDLRKDGRCQFIKTDFVYGEKGKDGKIHNYWVYHLYEFIGSELRPADQLLSGFPKWIWWSFKENHKATDQLTDEQKQRIWNKQRSP